MVLQASRSGRHPVKVEIAGSSPVRTALGHPRGLAAGAVSRGRAPDRRIWIAASPRPSCPRSSVGRALPRHGRGSWFKSSRGHAPVV
jgi:hypothetical protein